MHLQMSDKINLYIKQSGKGYPCIFIHGGPGSYSYNFQMSEGKVLENFMKMIYFDQRGCGRSEGNADSEYSINRIIEDIEEIRKHLGIQKWIVIAHSFGGIIAANYVNKYKKYVNGLILLNCTLNMEDSLKSQIYHGCKLLGEDISLLDSSKSTLENWQIIFKKLFEKDIYFKLQYNDYNNYLKINELDNKIENINTSMANQAFNNKEYFTSYYNLTKYILTPVLIITGSDDYAIGPNHYKNFMFPNKKVNIIKGKHVLYLAKSKKIELSIKKFIKSLDIDINTMK